MTGCRRELRAIRSSKSRDRLKKKKLQIQTSFYLTLFCSCSNERASLVAQLVKNVSAMQETQFDSWVGKIPWRRDRLPTPVCLGFPVGLDGKESAYNAGDLGSKDPLRRVWQPTPVFLPGKSPWTEEATVHGVAKCQTLLNTAQMRTIKYC